MCMNGSWWASRLWLKAPIHYQLWLHKMKIKSNVYKGVNPCRSRKKMKMSERITSSTQVVKLLLTALHICISRCRHFRSPAQPCHSCYLCFFSFWGVGWSCLLTAYIYTVRWDSIRVICKWNSLMCLQLDEEGFIGLTLPSYHCVTDNVWW